MRLFPDRLCNRCGGRGTYRCEDRQMDYVCPCVSAEHKITEGDLPGFVNIPDAYRHVTGSNFVTDWDGEEFRDHREGVVGELGTIFKELASGRNSGLFLWGETGVGKTHLCVAMIKELALGGEYVRFEDVLHLSQDMLNSINTRRLPSVIEHAIECSVLLLDDMGSERTTPFVKDQMANIVSRRYNDEKPILFNSNVSPHQLCAEKKLSESILSRIVGGCRIINLLGSDYRKRGAACA